MVDLDAVADMGLVDDCGSELPSVHFDTVEFHGVQVQVTRPTCDYAPNGWIGPDHPRNASAEWGKEMLETVAAWVAEFIEAFRKAPLPKSGR